MSIINIITLHLRTCDFTVLTRKKIYHLHKLQKNKIEVLAQ